MERLLEEQYEIHKDKKQKLLDHNAEQKLGLTIAADGATISKRPLTNLCVLLPYYVNNSLYEMIRD